MKFLKKTSVLLIALLAISMFSCKASVDDSTGGSSSGSGAGAGLGLPDNSKIVAQYFGRGSLYVAGDSYKDYDLLNFYDDNTFACIKYEYNGFFEPYYTVEKNYVVVSGTYTGNPDVSNGSVDVIIKKAINMTQSDWDKLEEKYELDESKFSSEEEAFNYFKNNPVHGRITSKDVKYKECNESENLSISYSKIYNPFSEYNNGNSNSYSYFYNRKTYIDFKVTVDSASTVKVKWDHDGVIKESSLWFSDENDFSTAEQIYSSKDKTSSEGMSDYFIDNNVDITKHLTLGKTYYLWLKVELITGEKLVSGVKPFKYSTLSTPELSKNNDLVDGVRLSFYSSNSNSTFKLYFSRTNDVTTATECSFEEEDDYSNYKYGKVTLTSSGTYYFWLTVKTDTEESDYSEVLEVKFEKVAKPTCYVDSGIIHVTNYNSSKVDYYKIYRNTENKFETKELVNSYAIPKNNYLYNFPETAGTYYYWIVAVKDLEESDYSEVLEVKYTSPKMEISSVESDTDGTYIAVKFYPMDDIKQYEVYWSEENDITTATSKDYTITNADNQLKTIKIIDVSKGKKYYIWMKPKSDTITFGYSEAKVCRCTALETPYFYLTNDSDNKILLTIASYSFNSSYTYKFYRAKDSWSVEDAQEITVESDPSYNTKFYDYPEESGTYYYWAAATSGDDVSDFSDYRKTEFTKYIISPVTVITATEDRGTITVTWNPPKVGTPVKYIVYGRDNFIINGIENTVKKLKETTATTVTITAADNPEGSDLLSKSQYVYFHIRAVDADGNESALDSGFYDNCYFNYYAVSAPQNFRLEPSETEGKMKLAWDAVENASYYEVYEYSSYSSYGSSINETNWRKISGSGVIKTTSYEISVPTSSDYYYYYYTVKAFNDGDAKSPYATHKTLCLKSPSTPTVSSSKGTVNLSWSAPDSYGTYTYNIYASTDNGTYTKIKTVETTSATLTEDDLPEESDLFSSSRYLYFKIGAVNEIGIEISMSSYDRCYYTYVPIAAPENVVAVYNETSKNLDISWDAVNKAAAYKVYYCGDSSSFTPSNRNSSYWVLFAENVTSTSCEYTGQLPDKYYAFAVVSVNTADEESENAYSNVVELENQMYGELKGLHSGYIDLSGETMSASTLIVGTLDSKGVVYYAYPVTNGKTYAVKWADSYAGKDSYTIPAGSKVDVKVSAYYASSSSMIINAEDSGYPSPKTFPAEMNGWIEIKVFPYHSGNTGSFAIAIYETE